MASRILYKASVEGDLRKIDRPIAAKLLQKLESVLSANPRAGTLLKGTHEGMCRYRIGDYRVVYTIVPDGVLVLRIAHRKDVYR